MRGTQCGVVRGGSCAPWDPPLFRVVLILQDNALQTVLSHAMLTFDCADKTHNVNVKKLGLIVSDVASVRCPKLA